MQLYYFLAIVISLSFGSLPPSETPFSQAVGFSASVVIAWWILCGLATVQVSGLIRSGDVSIDTGLRWFERQTTCLRWLSLALVALCLGGFGLARNLSSLPVLGSSNTLQSLLLLSPAIMMMLGMWIAEHLFSVRQGWDQPGWRALAGSVWSAIRGNIGWLVTPILCVMLVTDIASHFTTEIPSWLGWGALASLILFGIPMVISRVFPTVPMDAEDRVWFQSILSSVGMGRCRIIVWDTRHRFHNAMIAGVLGRFRILLVTDRLLAELPRQELAMVILHEVAHAKRRHVPLRMLSLVPAWAMGLAVQHRLSSGKIFGIDGSAWAALVGTLISILATVLVLRWVSYRIEHDADKTACRLAPLVAIDCEDVPASEQQAQQRLASALAHVTAGSDSAATRSWLHPSVVDRVEVLSLGSGNQNG